MLSQPEINASESKELEEIVRKLTDTYQKLAKTQTKSDDNDEYICIICYSHQIQGEFRPCKHQACLYVKSLIFLFFLLVFEHLFFYLNLDHVLIRIL